MKVKVLIEVEQKVWDAVPTVARWLNLPMDTKQAETASMLFETLLFDAYLNSEFEKEVETRADMDVEEAVNQLLDPNVQVPIALQIAAQIEQEPQTLTQYFDEVLEKDPSDIYAQAVQAKADNNLLWKCALASVYQVVRGDERRQPATWALIERTYRLLSRPGGSLKESMDRPVDKSGE